MNFINLFYSVDTIEGIKCLSSLSSSAVMTISCWLAAAEHSAANDNLWQSTSHQPASDYANTTSVIVSYFV